ncbi:MAG: hypothetical protein J6A08_08730 [Lachnospiraceae bacterium]|nr:hypothetical protein [Lachnospiraceae bacterium]
MRLIKEMVRAILKLLFQIDTENPITELLESTEQKETLEELLRMIDEGEINEAENRLSDLVDGTDKESLKTALLFYSALNEKTDDFLLENNFSRDEIRLGIESVTEKFGVRSLAESFLDNF